MQDTFAFDYNTLPVAGENKQCNPPQHYLYRITSLLVFRTNILQMKLLDHSSKNNLVHK